MMDLVHGAEGKITLPVLQGFYGDHQSTICKHFGRLTRWSSIPPAAKPTSPGAPAAWPAGSSLPWASACQECVFRRSS